MLAAFLFGTCEGPVNNVIYRDRIDTVRVEVPKIVIRDIPGRTRFIHDTIVDSVMLRRLSGMIDSLYAELDAAGIKRVFDADTVSPRGDTVYVTCNETARSASIEIRHAVVETEVRRTEVVKHLSKDPFTVHSYLTAAAVLVSQDAYGAQVSAGMQVRAGGRFSPFVDVNYSTIAGAWARIGLHVEF
jgi:hypothetical protein